LLSPENWSVPKNAGAGTPLLAAAPQCSLSGRVGHSMLGADMLTERGTEGKKAILNRGLARFCLSFSGNPVYSPILPVFVIVDDQQRPASRIFNETAARAGVTADAGFL
jgi:hypothetical protein